MSDMSCSVRFFRFILIIINVALVVGGAIGLFFAVDQYTNKNKNYIKFCTDCKNFNQLAIAVMGALVGFALFGILTMVKRNRCLSFLYGFLMIAFFLLALTGTIGVILLKEGKFDNVFEKGWNQAVRDDPNGVCDFMFSVKCSGWDVRCNMTEPVPTPVPVGTPTPMTVAPGTPTPATPHPVTATPAPATPAPATPAPATPAPATPTPATPAPATPAPATPAPATPAPAAPPVKQAMRGFAALATNEQCPDWCPHHPEVSLYNETCHDAVDKDINKYYKEMLGVGFALMGVALLSVYVSCNLGRKAQHDGYEEMNPNYA